MKFSGWVTSFCIAGGVAIGTFIAIAITDIATIDAAWCDTRPVCLRDWVGALSGWAAAGGAILAAVLTVPYLKKQASETKRQADFVVGDALPTLDVLEHLRDEEELVVRLVNWNRRAILINSINVVGIEGTTGLLEHEVDGEPPRHQGRNVFPIVVPGWEDRNQSPHFAKLNIAVVRNNENVLIKDWGGDYIVRADVQLIGEKHTKFPLHGDIRPK